MNDEQVQSALEMWFQGTDPQPPSAQRTATHVMAHVPQTRQRGRWLPLGLFRPGSLTPQATDTTEYQPSPITATNGHTPTVIGRTQTMFSPAKAVIAGALVFAIGGVMVIAQPFDQQGSVPGAATGDPAMAPSFFSGTIGDDWVTISLPVTERRDDGVVESTGESHTFPWDANDPRISGTATIITNETEYGDQAKTLALTGDVGTVRTGLIRIVNDEGSWEGQFSDLLLYDAREVATTEPSRVLYYDFENSAGWLTGRDAYDGLTAYFVWTHDGGEFFGHITAEGPPPAPEGLPG